jgi:hypothetical protein
VLILRITWQTVRAICGPAIGESPDALAAAPA